MERCAERSSNEGVQFIHIYIFEANSMNDTLQIYVGVDISKASFDTSNRGKHAKFTNNKKGHQQFIKSLPEGAWVVMEATGTYGHLLAETLVEHNFMVSVVNPLLVKRFAQSRAKRAKTDAVDAKLLVEYAQSLERATEAKDRLRLFVPPSPSFRYLQQIRSTIALLQKTKTMFSNQGEGQQGYTNIHPIISQSTKVVFKALDKAIDLLTEARDEIIAKHYKEAAKHLESIPGIARKTSTTVLSVIGDINRFESAKALAAFCGLCPRITESGSSVRGKSSLAKNGVGFIRANLYMCAMTASRFNEPCKQLYQRLIAKGKTRMTALLAVCHKLIRQIYAVLKYNCDFEPKHGQLKI